MTPLRPLATVSLVGAALTLGLAACGTRSGSAPIQHSISDRVALAAATNSAGTTPGGSPGTITTVGTGTVTGAPDTLTIGIGVSTTGSHAAGALSQNNDLAGKVQQALAQDGIQTKDIQTTGLSLQEAYPPSNGYQVFDEVTAKVHDLANAGKIIDDALTPAGDAGRLEMVDFSMSSTDPYMASARQSAVAAAKADAEQLATAAGEHLGSLISITDQQSPANPVYQGFATSGVAASGGSASPVPVQPGSQNVTVDVTTVWAIAP